MTRTIPHPEDDTAPHTPSPGLSEPTDAIVVVRIDGQAFGIPAGQARAIHLLGSVSPVPRAPEGISGLTDVDGRVSTVIDLPLRLGMDANPRDGRAAVTVEVDETLYTLPVDEIGDVVALPRRHAKAPSAGGETPWRPFASKIYPLDADRVLAILDIESLVGFD